MSIWYNGFKPNFLDWRVERGNRRRWKGGRKKRNGVLSFRLFWREHRRRGALWGNPRRGHSISRSVLIGHLFSAFAYSLEALPVLFPPDILNYTTDICRYLLAHYIKIAVYICVDYILITVDKCGILLAYWRRCRYSGRLPRKGDQHNVTIKSTAKGCYKVRS